MSRHMSLLTTTLRLLLLMIATSWLDSRSTPWSPVCPCSNNCLSGREREKERDAERFFLSIIRPRTCLLQMLTADVSKCRELGWSSLHDHGGKSRAMGAQLSTRGSQRH